jgi:hypothetical protein
MIFHGMGENTELVWVPRRNDRVLDFDYIRGLIRPDLLNSRENLDYYYAEVYMKQRTDRIIDKERWGNKEVATYDIRVNIELYPFYKNVGMDDLFITGIKKVNNMIIFPGEVNNTYTLRYYKVFRTFDDTARFEYVRFVVVEAD